MSDNNEMPTLLLLNDGKTLINLNQVRVIDQIREGHCRILFSETMSVTVTGEGADDLTAQLTVRSITVDGTSLLDIWKEKQGESENT